MTKRRVDWDAVERNYRTGQLTNIELSRRHELDPATLSRQIKKDKAKDASRWERDLTEVVRQATNARVMAETVKAKVKESQDQDQAVDAVKVAAEVRAQVILSHRQRAGRASDVAMRMLDELDATTLKTGDLEALFAKLSGADEEENPTIKRALMQQFRDFMKLHSRVASVQKLMAALKDAQALEAQNFGGLYEEKGDQGAPRDMSDLEVASKLAHFVDIGRRRAPPTQPPAPQTLQ